jgi:hypothetical protein
MPFSATPGELLRMAISQNAGIEQLSKLMDLQERWEKNEARKAFVVAMTEFKAHAIAVVRDKVNPQYNSKYVSLGQLVGVVTPFLSKHGLSCRWDIDQAAGIKVSCIVTHAGGHSESVSMVCPPDKSGAKNPIQEIKSAITYAKACTFESICGLASTDATLDDDGRGGTDPQGISEDRISEFCTRMAKAENIQQLFDVFKAAYTEADATKDRAAKATYIRVKDARKKELR